MTKQELQLQEEEEKYRVYMGMFGYEGDNSDLDLPIFRQEYSFKSFSQQRTIDTNLEQFGQLFNCFNECY